MPRWAFRSERASSAIASAPSSPGRASARCKGDFIALPVGVSGTHQLLNESDAPATVLLLARNETFEACYYPDSDKLLVDMAAPLISGRESLLIAASPQLDYFDGEA
jgi:uncharacterized cupin superfamily protein